jgi:hypothetical protein
MSIFNNFHYCRIWSNILNTRNKNTSLLCHQEFPIQVILLEVLVQNTHGAIKQILLLYSANEISTWNPNRAKLSDLTAEWSALFILIIRKTVVITVLLSSAVSFMPVWHYLHTHIYTYIWISLQWLKGFYWTSPYILHIYQKPTTSTVIHRTSCHPTEHKMAALNYLFNRLNTYPLSNTNRNKELNIIRQIATDNNYHSSSIMQNKANNSNGTKTHRENKITT